MQYNFGSNFSGPTDPPIEFSGPGNNLVSLTIGGGVSGLICGTSFAAPHIAGLLLADGQEPIVDGFVTNDPDNDSDPIPYSSTSPPGTPTISGSTQNDKPRIRWDDVSGADFYRVYRQSQLTTIGSKVFEITNTDFTDTNYPLNVELASGSLDDPVVYYFVEAVNSSGISDTSNLVWFKELEDPFQEF
ncbi:MAG: hypothetical protein R3211_01215 [Balneolaceae bacterium]|nr:hypothetical protein [Balneolaceae bacterium]